MPPTQRGSARGLVVLDEPTVPGCHIRARPLRVFWMVDELGPDAKILAMPAGDQPVSPAE